MAEPDTIDPGEWIPPIFRSMVFCDAHGRVWAIDEGTWRWVPMEQRLVTVKADP